MRAAVYVPGYNELVFQDKPIPTPKAGEVLLKVVAAGVCHSDTFVLSAAVPDPRTYTLGHENVGIAEQLGSDVQGIAVGQLYAIWDATPCSLAHPSTTLSPVLNIIGIGRDGGFAEYIVVDQSELVPVPEGLAPEIACLAADSPITVYNAVHNVAQLNPETAPGKKVLIYGVGGLGHQAVQLASSYGATVSACDFKPEARALALAGGAVKAFDVEELQTALEPAAKDPYAADIVIDFVAIKQSFELGRKAVRRDVENFILPVA